MAAALDIEPDLELEPEPEQQQQQRRTLTADEIWEARKRTLTPTELAANADNEPMFKREFFKRWLKGYHERMAELQRARKEQQQSQRQEVLDTVSGMRQPSDFLVLTDPFVRRRAFTEWLSQLSREQLMQVMSEQTPNVQKVAASAQQTSLIYDTLARTYDWERLESSINTALEQQVIADATAQVTASLNVAELGPTMARLAQRTLPKQMALYLSGVLLDEMLTRMDASDAQIDANTGLGEAEAQRLKAVARLRILVETDQRAQATLTVEQRRHLQAAQEMAYMQVSSRIRAEWETSSHSAAITAQLQRLLDALGANFDEWTSAKPATERLAELSEAANFTALATELHVQDSFLGRVTSTVGTAALALAPFAPHIYVAAQSGNFGSLAATLSAYAAVVGIKETMRLVNRYVTSNAGIAQEIEQGLREPTKKQHVDMLTLALEKIGADTLAAAYSTAVDRASDLKSRLEGNPAAGAIAGLAVLKLGALFGATLTGMGSAAAASAASSLAPLLSAGAQQGVEAFAGQFQQVALSGAFASLDCWGLGALRTGVQAALPEGRLKDALGWRRLDGLLLLWWTAFGKKKTLGEHMKPLGEHVAYMRRFLPDVPTEQIEQLWAHTERQMTATSGAPQVTVDVEATLPTGQTLGGFVQDLRGTTPVPGIWEVPAQLSTPAQVQQAAKQCVLNWDRYAAQALKQATQSAAGQSTVLQNAAATTAVQNPFATVAQTSAAVVQQQAQTQAVQQAQSQFYTFAQAANLSPSQVDTLQAAAAVETAAATSAQTAPETARQAPPEFDPVIARDYMGWMWGWIVPVVTNAVVGLTVAGVIWAG